MDVISPDTNARGERGALVAVVLVLVVVGLGLAYTSWQTVLRQRQAVERHMLLTARSVLQAVEVSLARGMMGRRGGNPMQRGAVGAYFKELQQGGHVRFVGFIGPGGGRILASFEAEDGEGPTDGRAVGRKEGEAGPEVVIPRRALDELESTGAWRGLLPYGDDPSFVYARKVSMRRFMRGPVPGAETDDAGPDRYLVVGLSMAGHMEVYESFHQNALIQTAYTLGAASLLGFLTLALLRRRAMAGKAAGLERFQASLLDALPDGLLTINAQGRILAANPAAAAILEEEVLPGRDIADLPPAMAEGLAQALARAHDAAGPEAGETWRPLALGGKRLEIKARPLEDKAGDRLVLVRDRSREHELESSLAEAEKLALVGSLAAGVAHEIRNPLSALRGFAQLFAKKFKGREPEEGYAATMVREADRLNRVVSDLLTLARPRAPRPVRLDRAAMAAMAQDVARLLDMEFAERGVVFETDLAETAVWADPDALKQALINLCINAAQAVAESGAEQGRVRLFTRREGAVVLAGVADDGPGLSEEATGRLFEPFFTTKDHGAGLGLAIVEGVAKAHGGRAVAVARGDLGGAEVALALPVKHDERDI